MKKTLVILLVVVLAVSLFVSCSPEAKIYTVTFSVDGDTTLIAAQSVKSGNKAEKPDDPVKTGYYLSAWNTADGKKFDFNNDTVTSDITLTAVWKDTYNIGDVGPAGGWIFYDVDADNASGDKDGLNSYDAGWRYIEAAPDNWSSNDGIGDYTGESKLSWGTDVAVTTGTGIGEGKSNTANMIAITGASFPAAEVCHCYSVAKSGNTISGWFLPSRDELAALYAILVKSDSTTKKGTWKTGTDAIYWSSSVESGIGRYAIKFSSGDPDIMFPGSTNYVRPVHYV